MKAEKGRDINGNKKDLSPEQRKELREALQARFEKNMNRHKSLEWAKVQAAEHSKPTPKGALFILRLSAILARTPCLGNVL